MGVMLERLAQTIEHIYDASIRAMKNFVKRSDGALVTRFPQGAGRFY